MDHEQPVRARDTPAQAQAGEGAVLAAPAPLAPVPLPLAPRVPIGVPLGAPATAPLSRLARLSVVRRTLWTYDGTDWKDGLDHVGAPVGLPMGPFAPNDAFDDTSGTLTNGRNGAVKGEPGRFVGYDDASDAHTQQVRKGLGFAKLKVQRAIRLLTADQTAAAAPGGAYSAQLQRIVETAFNGVPSAPLVTIFLGGLQRVLDGLSSADLDLVVATKMRLYGKSQEADCSGWVPRGITEMGDRGVGAAGLGDLQGTSRPIHLNPRMFANTNFVGDVIVHEAMHRYLGAYDFSYVGTPGSVEPGLQQKAADKLAATPALGAAGARTAAKQDAAARAHAQLVQSMVAKAADDAGLTVPQRIQPAVPTDAPAVAAVKQAWQAVRGWGAPQAPVPALAAVRATALALTIPTGMPKGLVTQLNAFLADADSFLAENGNELGVKGHDVLFALPTANLLKNADSWTELATQLA